MPFPNPFKSPTQPTAPNITNTTNRQIGTEEQVQGINAPPQTGIFGNTQYSYGSNGQVTGVNTSLNPQMQGVENTLLGSLGTRPDDVSNAVYGQYSQRLDPQWEQSEKAQRDMLANQGIPPGSQAYNDSMQQFYDNRDRAYLQANQAATVAGGQEQSRLLGGLYGLGGVSTAGYQNVPQIGTPNTVAMQYQNFNAQQDAYNQQLASQNAGIGGLFGLGSVAIGAFGSG